MNTTKRSHAIFIYILTAFFLCFEMGVQVSPSIMITPLMHDLKIGVVSLGIMSGFYYYTYTIMQIPAGLLFDRFNVRLMITIPLLVCSIGAYFFSVADSFLLASLARLLMGAGSAFAFIAVLVVSADLFDKKYFALLVGITQMLAAFGAMSGQLPLSYLVRSIGWRNTMMTLSVVGITLSLLIWFFIRYKKNNSFGKSISPQMALGKSLKTILLKKQTWFIAFYACLLWAPMAAFASLWGVPYLEKAYHLTNSDAAFRVSIMWIGIAIGSPFLGWWSDRISSRIIPLFASAFVGLASTAIILYVPYLPFFVILSLLFLMGAGCSGQALSFAVVKDNNSNENLAAAIGFNNMAVVVAGAIFQPLIGKLIQLHMDNNHLIKTFMLSDGDYRFGLSVLIVCFLIGALISMFLIKETLSLKNRRKQVGKQFLVASNQV